MSSQHALLHDVHDIHRISSYYNSYLYHYFGRTVLLGSIDSHADKTGKYVSDAHVKLMHVGITHVM